MPILMIFTLITTIILKGRRDYILVCGSRAAEKFTWKELFLDIPSNIMFISIVFGWTILIGYTLAWSWVGCSICVKRCLKVRLRRAPSVRRSHTVSTVHTRSSCNRFCR